LSRQHQAGGGSEKGEKKELSVRLKNVAIWGDQLLEIGREKEGLPEGHLPRKKERNWGEKEKHALHPALGGGGGTCRSKSFTQNGGDLRVFFQTNQYWGSKGGVESKPRKVSREVVCKRKSASKQKGGVVEEIPI